MPKSADWFFLSGTGTYGQGWGRGCEMGSGPVLHAAAPVRVASRASRGGPGRLWPPRDARDVREIQGRARVRHDLCTSVTDRRVGTGSPERSRGLIRPGTLRGGSTGSVRRLYPYTATSDERTSAAPGEDGRNRDIPWVFVTDRAPPRPILRVSSQKRPHGVRTHQEGRASG